MSKNKYSIDNINISSSSDGVILISMSIGIFLIISIFTFFLMKLVVKEHRMSINYAHDIKTRNLAHSALERGIFQFSSLRNITSQSGELNNGDYEISYDGINDQNNDPLPYSHYAMLNSDAEINDSKRRTRIFLSSFPSGFNPAFYGENANNNAFSGSAINGGYLYKRNGNLYHNGNLTPEEGIMESMPAFNNIYDDEINWTNNNVEINATNAGANPNNKYLSFDGNDYVRVPYSTTTTTTTYETTTVTTPVTTTTTTTNNITATFEGKSGSLGGSAGYKDMSWHNRFYVLNGSTYCCNAGYKTAVKSGTQVAFNAWDEQNVWFESKDGKEFDFKYFYVASAWNNSQNLKVKAYKNGSQKYTNSSLTKNGVTIERYNRKKITVNFNDVDKIMFYNSGSHVAYDDFNWDKTTTTTTTTNETTTITTPVTTTTTTSILPQGNGSRTVTAWVRPTNNNNTWSMVQFGTGDCTGKMWGLGRRNGKLGLWGGCKDWTSNLSIPSNEWSFVVLRYNGTKVRAYVNGTWDETTLNGFNTQISDLFIGGETTNNGSSFRSYFTGDIDEVAIWNKALSNAEILALYNGGTGIDAATNGGGYSSKANLKGYWKFNEGSGSIVSDASGNGKNGTRYGASWSTGSHTQPQPGPLTFNAGTQLNLNSPNCGSDHTSLCTNNKIAVNQNIIFTDTDITGMGIIVATGKITIKQNSTINGGITLIAQDIEINSSNLGNASLFNSGSGPVIIYTQDGGIITNTSNVSGLIINYDTNNSDSFTIDNSTVKGAVLNYGSNFQLNNSTTIIGSVVSQYLVTINSGSNITKGSLPSFYGQNIGLSTSVIPGSYLEY